MINRKSEEHQPKIRGLFIKGIKHDIRSSASVDKDQSTHRSVQMDPNKLNQL